MSGAWRSLPRLRHGPSALQGLATDLSRPAYDLLPSPSGTVMFEKTAVPPFSPTVL